MNEVKKHSGHLVEARGWTKNVPIIPGDYRWRMHDTVTSGEIVTLSKESAGLLVRFYEPRTGFSYADELGGEWCGPLAPPIDEPAQAWYKAEEVEVWLQGERDKVKQRSPGAAIGEAWKESALDVLDGLLERLRKGRG